MNPHPHTYFMNCIHPLRWKCEILEDEVNHDTSMENHETNCEPKEEKTITSLKGLAALLNMGGEETSPPSHLDPHRSNIVMGKRPFLRGLQGAAFQTLMKCKKQELVWEDGALMGGVPKKRISGRVFTPLGSKEKGYIFLI